MMAVSCEVTFVVLCFSRHGEEWRDMLRSVYGQDYYETSRGIKIIAETWLREALVAWLSSGQGLAEVYYVGVCYGVFGLRGNVDNSRMYSTLILFSIISLDSCRFSPKYLA